jgi:dihydrodipicolinate synthase/N-acetylneuraminate lyase
MNAPNPSELRGVWAAMPLPWNADGSLDTGALNELVGRYAAAGVDGAYCTGTDGEFHTLEADEFATVATAFARAAERVNLPVQAGTGWLTLQGAIARTRIARDLGIRWVQVVPPFWMPVNDIERVRFYGALAEAVPEVGIILYNTDRIGRILGAEQIRELAEAVPSIAGSKYDGLDKAEFAEICAATPDLAHLPVDLGIGPSAAYPTKGLCSWMANLNPDWMMEWWRAVERGDWGEADRRYELAMAAWADWEPIFAPLTASPALSKICTRAGILPSMPLRVRAPYLGGTEDDVVRLRALLERSYPELVYHA